MRMPAKARLTSRGGEIRLARQRDQFTLAPRGKGLMRARHTFRRVCRWTGTIVPAAAAVLIGFQVRTSAHRRPRPPAAVARGRRRVRSTEDPFKLGLKFHGRQRLLKRQVPRCRRQARRLQGTRRRIRRVHGVGDRQADAGAGPALQGVRSLAGATPKGKKGQEIYAKYKLSAPLAPRKLRRPRAKVPDLPRPGRAEEPAGAEVQRWRRA